MERGYRICRRCIMDTTDPDIEFDHDGVCNHCREYDTLAKKLVFTGEEGRKRLSVIVDKIKEVGKGQNNDCIIGLSGGLDSTYAAYIARKMGLKPLVVHVDNEWDSEIAINNIKNTVKKLGLDLYTPVINWDEFKDLQLAYLRASVVDVEVLSDHAITAALYNIANQKGMKYILSGVNVVTEGVMPKSWNYIKNDLINLKAIHNKFGMVKLRSYPTLGLWKRLYYQHIKNIKCISILNYVPYVKKDTKKLLTQELSWQDYGGKHYESIFTRFYQAYILPRKFNIDKRKAHLSSLICSGQITREEAISEMQKDLYTDQELKRDREYVLKKLGLTNGELEAIMSLPVKSHYDYETDIKNRRFVTFSKRIFKKVTFQACE